MNNQIEKIIIKTRDNDAAIINTAIKIVDNERSVMGKKIHQRDQVRRVYITSTHKRSNSFTHDGKNVQFKSKPSIDTYQKHDTTPMLK